MLGVIHDVLIVIAFYAIFGVTVDNPFIAGILTVVGYSINDTIVIFDRIRENIKYMKRGTLKETIDRSITQTLGRSLMTSATTLIVMVPMVILAGEAIREFVFPLMVGVIAGAYSSIFVCSPIYYELGRSSRTSEYQKQIREAEKRAKKKAKKEGRPYVPKKIEEPALEKSADIVEETSASESAPEPAVETQSGGSAANVNKKRSKRYVKGNSKSSEPRKDDDTFRF